mgnify:CR=1 FL=1
MSKTLARQVKYNVEDTLDDVAKTLRRAADELSVTQSAVSRQIQALEDELGARLETLRMGEENLEELRE